MSAADSERSADDMSCSVVVNSIAMECPAEGGLAPGQDRALVVDSYLGAGFSWQGAALVAAVHTEHALDLAPTWPCTSCPSPAAM